MERMTFEFAKDICESLLSFIAVDETGKIVFISKGYAKGLGISPEDALGRPVEEIISNTRLHLVLQQKKSEWNQYMWAESALTGEKTTGPTLCNRILIYHDGDKENIVGAMAFGAVIRQHDEQELTEELDMLRQQNKLYQKHIADVYQASYSLDEILGSSTQISDMKSLIRRVANTAVSVCIFGETGTGKELVANAIHKLSKREKEPFIKINCAAIPKDLMESELFGYEAGAFTGAARQGKLGMFELANGGTLLLDEIGELPLNLQAKLLRVLQEGEIRRVGGTKVIPVDVRLVCSTNRDLQEMVNEDKFRADLYYRIHTVKIVVPPLRDRLDDIPEIADYFIRQSNKRNGLAISGMQAKAYQALAMHDWPGNVRELEHCIERACVLCGAGYLAVEHLGLPIVSSETAIDIPQEVFPKENFETTFEDAEAEIIRRALDACGGNRLDTANMLNISRTTLFRKMKKYNLL